MNISEPFIGRPVATARLTTPAIHVAFDRLATRFRRRHAHDDGGTLADSAT